MSDIFCAVELQVGEEFTARPWPQRRIGYYLDTAGYNGGIAKTAIVEVLAKAWAGWSDVIDIEPFKAASASTCQVLMRFGTIDGPGKILAWSHISDGTNNQKQQLYDAGEEWEKQNGISMLAVGAHEIGHVLGLFHETQNVKALMRPTYDPNVRFPQARDVERMIALGYDSAPIVPPEPPAPTNPGTPDAVFRVYGNITKIDVDTKLPVSPLTLNQFGE